MNNFRAGDQIRIKSLDGDVSKSAAAKNINGDGQGVKESGVIVGDIGTVLQTEEELVYVQVPRTETRFPWVLEATDLEHVT